MPFRKRLLSKGTEINFMNNKLHYSQTKLVDAAHLIGLTTIRNYTTLKRATSWSAATSSFDHYKKLHYSQTHSTADRRINRFDHYKKLHYSQTG